MLDRPTTDADRAVYDLNRRALRHWPLLRSHILDIRSEATSEMRRLGDPTFDGRPNGRIRGENVPRLTGLRGPHPNDFSWFSIDPPGARGRDLIDMVAYLGSVDRQRAMQWLRDFCDRIREVA
jgi:hypothetical protein